MVSPCMTIAIISTIITRMASTPRTHGMLLTTLTPAVGHHRLGVAYALRLLAPVSLANVSGDDEASNKS